jgi:L-alanine-DL-glutamate epimerase-like enolase superfamily enzyme
VSLWRFFGGRRHGARDGHDRDHRHAGEARAAARQIRQRGIRIIKAKVGGPGGPGADLERISAILEAAPGSPLVLDGNAALGRAEASQLVRGLKAPRDRPLLLEQWLPKDDLDGMRALGARVRMGRGGRRERDDRRGRAPRGAFRARRQVINIKLMKAGIAEALEVASVARGAGIGLMIGGNIESILAMTVSACFAAGLGGFGYADLDTPLFLAENPFEGGFTLEGGRISVAHIEAGHGVHPRGLLL